MELSAKIVVEPFNEKYVIVYGNKQKLAAELASLDAEWYDDLGGWLIAKIHKHLLDNVVASQITFSLMEEVGKTCISSSARRQNKKTKYRRAQSDDEDSSPEVERRPRFRRAKKKSPPIVQTSFLLASESEDSSASSEESDFPEVDSPRNHEKEYTDFLRKQRKIKKNSNSKSKMKSLKQKR